jgi:phosphoadenosine phosphosulfate reductase
MNSTLNCPTTRAPRHRWHLRRLETKVIVNVKLAAIKDEPREDQLEGLRCKSLAMENAPPEEIIRWAVETYHPNLTMATAFGPEGCLLLSMLARIEPSVYVFNLDTGYQFQETLDIRDRIAEKYGIVVDYQRPELSIEQFEAEHGGPVHGHDSGLCCRKRKLDVLHRVAGGFQAWMSGIRRDQGLHRAKAPVIGWDNKFKMVKINPLVNWTRSRVWARITKEKIPYNLLHDRGYPSVGCRPCTRPVGQNEDERAGRWSGSEKTECGLHTTD